MASRLSIIGRDAAVKTDGTICLASVIDKIAGTNLAKRVRLQTGEHAGEVRTLGQYELVKVIRPKEDASDASGLRMIFAGWLAARGD